MRKYLFYTTTVALLILIGLILTQSCDKSPIDNTKLIFNYDIVKTKINLRFTDAATGIQIGQVNKGTKVNVKITGKNKDVVIDVTGLNLDNNSATTESGFMSLGLNPNTEYIPSTDNPITFNVVASVDGYIKSSIPVTIVKEGDYQYELYMVKLDAPPDGVKVTQEQNAGNVQNGEITESFNVTTPGNEASISFDAGTTVLGENGQPLNGNLDVMITHFDNMTDAALVSFPGGLTPTVNQDGGEQSGVFYSAGFVAIEVTDDNGNKAESFQNGKATIEIAINPETYNPETKGKVKAGDEVPLYSYDEETGQWTFEDILTVEESAKGLTATAKISHLSYWNLDWFYYDNVCYEGVKLNFHLIQGACPNGYLLATMRKAEDDSYLSSKYIYLGQENNIYDIINAAGNIPVYIVFESPGYGNNSNYSVQPTILTIPDLCSNEMYDLNVSPDSPSQTVVVDFSAYCPDNPDLILRPSFNAWYKKANGYIWKSASMIDGHAEICGVEIGETYVVGTYYNGFWYQETITVNQTLYEYLNFELPPDICEELNGGF